MTSIHDLRGMWRAATRRNRRHYLRTGEFRRDLCEVVLAAREKVAQRYAQKYQTDMAGR